jgi:hypothetical protein
MLIYTYLFLCLYSIVLVFLESCSLSQYTCARCRATYTSTCRCLYQTALCASRWGARAATSPTNAWARSRPPWHFGAHLRQSPGLEAPKVACPRAAGTPASECMIRLKRGGGRKGDRRANLEPQTEGLF